ncbi:MAG: DUF721 domain-containing protein [Ignavibacteria bacterium]|nr:MAG: DUF721 domain-containing protein [Ignavibacteria bacterium]
MHNEIKSVKDVLSNSDEFSKFRTAVEGFDVLENIYKIFPELKSFIVPKKIEKKTLFIRVNNSVMRSELTINRDKMKNKINKFFNKEIVKEIRFI